MGFCVALQRGGDPWGSEGPLGPYVGGWAKSYYHSCLSVTEGQWLLVRLGPNPTSGPRGPSGPHGSPWLGTRLPKTTDRFKKISPKIQNWCLTFGWVATLQTSFMVFHKIGTANTRKEASPPSRKVGLDQIVIALPIHVLGLLCWNHLPVTRSIPVGHCQTCPISSLACLRLSRNRKALHSHSTAVLHGSFAPPPKCNVGQTHPAGGIKKIVSTTLPINIAFWGAGGRGLQQKL